MMGHRRRPGAARDWPGAGNVIRLPDLPPHEPPALGFSQTPSPTRLEGGNRPVRVIALESQEGSGGDVVARAAVRRLGFRLVDEEVIRAAAKRMNLSEDDFLDAVRIRGRLERLATALSRSAAAGPETWMASWLTWSDPHHTMAELRSAVREAITDFAGRGRVLIFGHGAHLALADCRDTLRVLVAGSLEVRAARMASEGVWPDATRWLRENDGERVAHFKHFWDARWLEPQAYDLLINTDRTPPMDAVGLVLEAVKRRSASRAAASKQG